MVIHSPNGLNYGKVLKVLHSVDEYEVRDYLFSKGYLQIGRLRDPNDTIWAVDPPVKGKGMRGGVIIDIPYCMDKYLQPLPPPDDPTVAKDVATDLEMPTL